MTSLEKARQILGRIRGLAFPETDAESVVAQGLEEYSRQQIDARKGKNLATPAALRTYVDLTNAYPLEFLRREIDANFQHPRRIEIKRFEEATR